MSYLSSVKRGFLVLCVLSLLFADAQSTTPAKVLPKQVTFQKVQEKTYDKPIRDIAFDKAIVDGEVQVYPNVIVFGDEVQFLNEKGGIVTRKSLVVTKTKEVGKYFGKTAMLSSKGNFVVVNEYTGKFADAMDYIVEEEFTICNDRGEEIYRINGPVKGMGEGDQWLISDKDGSVVGTRIAYGAIDFYSPDGSIKTVPLFGELGWRNAVGNAILSGDGEYLAVLVMDKPGPIRGARYRKADLWVMLFDITGNEVWRREVDEQQYGNIAISEHGEYLFFKAFTFGEKKERRNKGEERPLTSVTLSLYDKEGNEVSFKDTSLFTFGGFCFSPQATYLALAGDNIIRLMSTNDTLIVFEKELPPKNMAIRQLLFSSDGEYLIIKGRVPIGTVKVPERGGSMKRIYGSLMHVLDINGNEIWQKDFPDLTKSSYSSGFLVFSCPEKYEMYKLK